MKIRRADGTPRMAFGCMAVGILALVVIGAFAVIFVWDVNVT